MGIRLQFQDGPLTGTTRQFSDDVVHIDIGRNPERCQVVLPPNETQVGRLHCAIRHVCGHHRLGLNPTHTVLMDGRVAGDGQELHDGAVIQLGPRGPKLRVEFFDERDMAATDVQAAVKRPGRPGRPRRSRLFRPSVDPAPTKLG